MEDNNENGFKPNKWLNNGITRIVNILFLLLVFHFISNEFNMGGWKFLVGAIVSIYPFAISMERISKNISFLEWDYSERKKKEAFQVFYTIVNYFFFTMFFATLFTIVSQYDSSLALHKEIKPKAYYSYIILEGVSLLIFLVNGMFTINLWYPIFKSSLTIRGRIQDKPENWID